MIHDAAVIGIPHEDLGEVPMAFVVKRDETDITEDQVVQYMAGKNRSHYSRVQLMRSISSELQCMLLTQTILYKYISLFLLTQITPYVQVSLLPFRLMYKVTTGAKSLYY